MNYKVKSFMYFATLVIAVVTYYNIDSVDIVQNTEMANNNIENVSTADALN